MFPHQHMWENFPWQALGQTHPDLGLWLCLASCSRHKSKQALRDYQKVLVQLENLETGVGDQCRKEFTGMWGYRWEDRVSTRPKPTS